MEQSLMDKLTILADSAKYDVACTSSGASHPAKRGTIGSCYAPGCCHAFTADGRCVSLLKVLMSNCCAFDCSYCVNRKSNDVPRATFSPRELAELTIEFYRRNYIEGLFLSSAVLGTPDYTTERMLTVLRLLRNEYRFAGSIQKIVALILCIVHMEMALNVFGQGVNLKRKVLPVHGVQHIKTNGKFLAEACMNTVTQKLTRVRIDKVERRCFHNTGTEIQQQAVFLRNAVKAPSIVAAVFGQVKMRFHPVAAPNARVKVRHHAERLRRSFG